MPPRLATGRNGNAVAFGAAYHFNNNRTFVAAHRLANFEPIVQSVRDLNKLDD